MEQISFKCCPSLKTIRSIYIASFIKSWHGLTLHSNSRTSSHSTCINTTLANHSKCCETEHEVWINLQVSLMSNMNTSAVSHYTQYGLFHGLTYTLHAAHQMWSKILFFFFFLHGVISLLWCFLSISVDVLNLPSTSDDVLGWRRHSFCDSGSDFLENKTVKSDCWTRSSLQETNISSSTSIIALERNISTALPATFTFVSSLCLQ